MGIGRLQLKCDGTRWRTVGEMKGGGGNWRMQWVASTLHTTSEHGVSSITTADAAHLGWPAVDWTDAPHRADLNGLVRFARKTKCGFCACAVICQLASSDCSFYMSVCLLSWRDSIQDKRQTDNWKEYEVPTVEYVWLYRLKMCPDKLETCRGGRNILRLMIVSSWFFIYLDLTGTR